MIEIIITFTLGKVLGFDVKIRSREMTVSRLKNEKSIILLKIDSVHRFLRRGVFLYALGKISCSNILQNLASF